MQDFAKNTTVVDRELAQPVGEWKFDAASVLFGVLLGAIVVFAGLKAADYREIQHSNEKSVNLLLFLRETSILSFTKYSSEIIFTHLYKTVIRTE